MLRWLVALLLIAPLSGHAEDFDGAARAAMLPRAVALGSAGVARGVPAARDASALRSAFERAMASVVADLPGLVVTSKARSEADQERLRAAGYRPHRHSQHKLGLAWDLAGSPEVLHAAAERARERGLVVLAMRSPVTGASYLHVQRFARSPLRDGAASDFALAALAPSGPTTALLDDSATTALPQAGPPEESTPDQALATTEPPPTRPRPVRGSTLSFPRRLLAEPARGTIVLLLEINEAGEVEDLRVDESDLPDFEAFVAREVKRWQFTPALREGRAVAATARLPIPIHIQ